MKKLINIVIAVIIGMSCSIDAKRMVQKTTTPAPTPIPVTKNEKNIFVDTKQVKAATTPEEKVAAGKKLANDLKKDPYVQLKMEEKMILQEIKEKKQEINELEGEEIEQAIMELEDLEEELAIVQEQLEKYNKTQPKAVSRMKEWALYALITTFGLVVADFLITGGTGSAAVIAGASTLGGKLSSAATTAWNYLPSWRSPSPATSEATETVKELALRGAGYLASLAVVIATEEAKAAGLQIAYDTVMSYLKEAETNPATDSRTLKMEQLKAQQLSQELEQLHKKIETLKDEQARAAVEQY